MDVDRSGKLSAQEVKGVLLYAKGMDEEAID
jgi:hypothetical protein